MFSIEMFPAGRGDCLWIEYGSRPHRILIDGGVPDTEAFLRERIEKLPIEARRFDLIVVTHIDLDHIGGILKLLRQPPSGLCWDDFWFNGLRHLPEKAGVLGVKDAEHLTRLLEKSGGEWNCHFRGGPVAADSPLLSKPILLTGRMQVTVLAPTLERLSALRPCWEEEVTKAEVEEKPDVEEEDSGILGGSEDIDKLATMKSKADVSKTNGSSIALLAEFGGRRCLLAGDAWAPDLEKALGPLADSTGAVTVDAVKLSHHGGQRNTSLDLLQKIRCRDYLISTDGSRHQHPNPEAIARVIVSASRFYKPRLLFNYLSKTNMRWLRSELFGNRFESIYAPKKTAVKLELSDGSVSFSGEGDDESR